MLLHSPLRVPITKKPKYFVLNLNQYRNTHYMSLNKAKIVYKDLMQTQIKQLPKMEIIALKFVLFPKTRRRTDLGNVCSIHEKFFADALTEFGIIPDDDYKHLIGTTNLFGSIDKLNPRVDIYIYNQEGKT